MANAARAPTPSGKKRPYKYSGGIQVYDNIVCNQFPAKTWAVSEKQAQSNIKFQYRKKANLANFVPVTLLGKVTEIVD